MYFVKCTSVFSVWFMLLNLLNLLLKHQNGILFPKLFWPNVRKNCSSDREQLLNKVFEITRTIYSNSERSDKFWKQNVFLTCSWRFLRSNMLEQLKLKLEKIQKSAGKVRKCLNLNGWDCVYFCLIFGTIMYVVDWNFRKL